MIPGMRALKLVGWFKTLQCLAVVCLFTFGEATNNAGAEDGEPRWIITAECRMILVPAKGALALIEELSDEATIDATWKRVQERIERGEIESVAAVVARGVEDENLEAQTGEHLRYPTEFDPPQLPQKVPEEKPAEFLKAWPVVGVTPTAYESRHIGQALKVSASVTPDGEWIDATVSAQHERLVRWVKYDAGRLADGERISVEQPIFHTMKNTGRMYLRNGQRLLLGVHKAADPEVKAYELFVLRVVATPAGARQ